MSHQPSLIPTEPTPDQAARDAERAEYLERLRQYLQDPAFRQIEGFPLGDDEAILALSDPPYYTACPNPFLTEIIERWQQEREASRGAEELTPSGAPKGGGSRGEKSHATRNTQHVSTAPDSSTDGYHREPFAADVSEGKNDPIYNAHSYHTKVPHKAIMRYILHYTEPGDIVFDGFCGTGMTGVAAQLCGDKKEVESLGYFVDDNGNIYDSRPQSAKPPLGTADRQPISKKSPLPPGSPAPPPPISKLGARKAVLCDLSPAATFIAYNYNTPVDVAAFEAEAKRILAEVEAECGWMYETLHTDGKTKGQITHTIWSEVIICPQCSADFVYWDVAVDETLMTIQGEFICPSCGAALSKRDIDRKLEARYDPLLGETISTIAHIPVLIAYKVGNTRYEKKPKNNDFEVIAKIEQQITQAPIPTEKMLLREGKWGDQWRSGYHQGITHSHHFFFSRPLYVLAQVRNKATQQNHNQREMFWLITSTTEGIVQIFFCKFEEVYPQKQLTGR